MVAQELLSLKGPVSIYGDLWGGAGEGCLESLKSHSLSECRTLAVLYQVIVACCRLLSFFLQLSLKMIPSFLLIVNAAFPRGT